MRIVPSPLFYNAGNIRIPPNLPDPRDSGFMESEVEVDLRNCKLVRPAAALWCVIYPLLARHTGVECRVLAPENFGVCTYLESLGVFAILKDSGIEVDDRGITHGSSRNVVLPLTRIDNETQAESLANSALDALLQSGLGTANLYPLLSETFAELAANAVQHSASNIGAFALMEYEDDGVFQRFLVGVADGGIGVRRSLEGNPVLQPRVPYDWIAIELAARERYSGTGDPNRGIGLFGVAEDMRRDGRRLIVHSGIGSLEIGEDMQSSSRRTRLFPGTLAYASIPA